MTLYDEKINFGLHNFMNVLKKIAFKDTVGYGQDWPKIIPKEKGKK